MKDKYEINLSLQDTAPGKVEDEGKIAGLIDQINALQGVQILATKDNVYIRSLRLAGDAVDNQDGRFHTEDLQRLLELTNGVPMKIMHNKELLPIGRFFGGELVERDGFTYIMPYVYWPRDHSQASDLQINIDQGIYNEASLSFTFRKPVCSICEKDIRRCDHLPGKEYKGELCYFWYDGIVRVREGSIVDRGAQPGTGFEPVEGSLMAELSNKDKQDKHDKSNKILGGGMELELKLSDELALRLADMLGVKKVSDSGGFVNAVEKLAVKCTDLGAEVVKLKPNAVIGEARLKEVQEDILKIDLKICKFENREQTESLKTLVGKLDHDGLLALQDEKYDALGRVIPPQKCLACGSTDISRRQSEVEDPNSRKPVGRVRSTEGCRI